jgi:hypothetical protein
MKSNTFTNRTKTRVDSCLYCSNGSRRQGEFLNVITGLLRDNECGRNMTNAKNPRSKAYILTSSRVSSGIAAAKERESLSTQVLIA